MTKKMDLSWLNEFDELKREIRNTYNLWRDGKRKLTLNSTGSIREIEEIRKMLEEIVGKLEKAAQTDEQIDWEKWINKKRKIEGENYEGIQDLFGE
jgi:hypothetical protein